jgi:DNA repair protein RecO (recombination protein O)
VRCGATEPITGFSVADGGVLCETCRRGPVLSDGALVVLRQILGGQLGTALNTPSSAVTDEIDRIATSLLEHHVDRRLRSMGVLGRH